MKSSVAAIALILVTLCLNFGLFLFAYRKLAFPYLNEAQRMENAPFIFSYVLIGFLVSAVFSVGVARWLGGRKIARKFRVQS